MTFRKNMALRACLRDVNKIRARYGLDSLDELPPGKRRDLYSCPVAEALRPAAEVDSQLARLDEAHSSLTRRPAPYVAVSTYAIWINARAIINTHAMTKFIRLFDRGKYPNLVQH